MKIFQSALMLAAPDHLGPLVGFIGDELAEFGRHLASACSPRSASRVFIVGSARTALILLLSLSMISAGVFFGARGHSKVACSPDKFANGRQIRQRPERAAVVTASARSFPARICAIAEAWAKDDLHLSADQVRDRRAERDMGRGPNRLRPSS